MVVCDRYLASSIAYGEAQGVDAGVADRDPAVPAAAVADDPARHAAGRVAHAQESRRATSSSATCRCSAACARAICGRRSRPDWIRLEGDQRQGRRVGRRDQRRSVTTRAAVSARTSFTPLRFNTVAQASSVAPVVDTSSTSTTMQGIRRSGIRDQGSNANASCTFSCRSCFGNSICDCV